MMLPVAMAVASAIEPDGRGGFGAALMLGLAYAASVGGMGTYLGTAPNGVFRGVAETNGLLVSFGDWMLFAFPLSILLIVIIWLYLTRLAFPIRQMNIDADHPAQSLLSEDLGPLSRSEKWVSVIFVIAVASWISRRWVTEAMNLPPK